MVKHSAPGPYLGFALQPVRLCYHLLSAPTDASVSLEMLDDVAVHYSDGSVLLEQCKSALSHNALSDWSEDLWKTIANWLAAVESKKVNGSKATFRLYVTPPKSGKVSSAIHEAASPDAVTDLLKQIEEKLCKKADPPKCMPYVQKFMDAGTVFRNQVISRTSIFSNDVDPIQPLRTLLEPTVPDGSIEVICEAAIGMAQARADRLIRDGMPALIAVREFRKNFHAFVQQNNMPGYLASLSAVPSAAETNAVLTSRPMFVRQLQLIEATEAQQLRAASDLMRTSGDKVKWAEAGFIYDDTFKDWEDSLLRRHEALASEISDLYSEKPEVVRGRLVYGRCSVLQVPIGSRTIPDYFTHGAFNDLANKRELGWHPEHKVLLDEESEP
ncbi:ABC-three component system protein [Burkholderia cenocepacia]|uniref:ABC-three component system protein n=1 Tax=Burkholderia cenocepacia TaxID=95486 RepID=UPI000F590272|nr:ABC-three component system protein [Burkholderia cenocepacia]